jgi:hypothetical protein
MLKRILAGVVFFLMLTGGAAAGPLEDGAVAHRRGDYATAVRLWRPLAEQGVAKAQFFIGFMYEAGEGVPQDYAEAAKWVRLAAEQGLAAGQFSLGNMYNTGLGVPRDYAEAVKWYRLAADQGYADAQIKLAFMYGKGRGVPLDYVMTHVWFNIAASQYSGSEQAEERNRAARARDRAASVLTPAQIAKAEKLAREWKPK